MALSFAGPCSLAFVALNLRFKGRGWYLAEAAAWGRVRRPDPAHLCSTDLREDGWGSTAGRWRPESLGRGQEGRERSSLWHHLLICRGISSKGGSIFWLMVSIWDELVWGTVKKQNIMARNTFVIAQDCSNHGQGKTGREEEGRARGREEGREEWRLRTRKKL